MKNTIAIIGLLCALCAPAWAVTSIYSTGGTQVYPVVSGSAALTNTESWTLATGVEESNGTISLSRLYDAFNSNSIDSTNFGTVKAASGAATETNVLILRNSATTDAVVIYNKTALVNATAQEYSFDSMAHNLVAGGGAILLGVFQNSAAPPIDTSANLAAKSIILVAINQAGTFSVFYWDTAGSAFSWDGSAWQAGLGSTFGTSLSYHNYRAKLKNTGTQWQIEVIDLDASSRTTLTTAVNWSATRGIAGSKWIVAGDPYTNAWSGTQCVSKYQEKYKTTSPTATMGSVTVATTITQIPIVENNESGCSITWDYDISGAWVTGNTLAQLKTALIGQAPDTLNLRANLVSTGYCDASFYFESASLTK